MHNVSQRQNLRHLGEPLGGAEGLLEAVSFKKVLSMQHIVLCTKCVKSFCYSINWFYSFMHCICLTGCLSSNIWWWRAERRLCSTDAYCQRDVCQKAAVWICQTGKCRNNFQFWQWVRSFIDAFTSLYHLSFHFVSLVLKLACYTKDISFVQCTLIAYCTVFTLCYCILCGFCGLLTFLVLLFFVWSCAVC